MRRDRDTSSSWNYLTEKTLVRGNIACWLWSVLMMPAESFFDCVLIVIVIMEDVQMMHYASRGGGSAATALRSQPWLSSSSTSLTLWTTFLYTSWSWLGGGGKEFMIRFLAALAALHFAVDDYCHHHCHPDYYYDVKGPSFATTISHCPAEALHSQTRNQLPKTSLIPILLIIIIATIIVILITIAMDKHQKETSS